MIRTNFRIEERPMSSLFKLEDRCINMQDKYITMVQGDTLSFGVEIQDETGTPIDVDDALFVAKKDYKDSTFLFNETIANEGIIHIDTGIYAVHVEPSETSSAAAGRYYYQFKVEKSGDVFTIMRGILELEPEVEVM